MNQPDPNTELLDLLVEWEDRRAAGNQVSVETLCAGRPQLADGMRAGLAHLAAIDRVLADDTAETDAVPVLRGFEIRGWLGGGGMGDVYLARDKTLARQVAVKIPKPKVREVARGRFEREGQTLAQLRHADIVTVFAAGVTDAGVPYLVMDYIPGGTLADRLRDGPLPPAEAARVGARVARAVHHAHRNGVIHRDLKPSNIFFAEDGSPRVGDFGVAAVLAGESAAVGSAVGAVGRRLTATAGVAGTLAYCAPELFAGAPVPPGPATDVWALGVVLYQAVTGELPFDGADDAELKRVILTGTYRAPHDWTPAVPTDLAAVIGRCLATNPEERYTSAEDLAVALDRWQRALGRTRRVRQWAGGIAAVVALSVLAGAALRPLSDEERHARACEVTAEKMRATGTAALASDGLPRTALPRLNRAAVTSVTAADGKVTLQSVAVALVEFARTPGTADFEFAAVIRQVRGDDDSAVGLYIAHTFDAATGVHEWLALDFTDFGAQARAFTDRATGAKGGMAQLRGRRFREPDLSLDWPAKSDFNVATPAPTVRRWYAQPKREFGQPSAEKTLTVRVAGGVVRCTLDGRPCGEVPLARLRTMRSATPGQPAAVDVAGGLGLLIEKAAVVCLRASLDSIPALR